MFTLECNGILMAERGGTKEPFDEGERGVKSWLKTQHSKN